MPAPILSAPNFFPASLFLKKKNNIFSMPAVQMVQNKDLGFFGIAIVDNDQIEKVHD